MQVMSHDAIVRVIASLIASERAVLGGGRAWDCAGWSAETSLGPEGLALDSLEWLAGAEAVSRFFRLHLSPTDTLLHHEPLIGAWANIVASALSTIPDPEIAFATSGTTGLPKICRQPLSHLSEEVDVWAQRFPDRRRIVQGVPPHHIYGFLFAALLPSRLGLPVLDARPLPSSALRSVLRPGDLLVAAPTCLAGLIRTGEALPQDIVISSATGCLTAEVFDRLIAMGCRVTDIYGSSETGGIGSREAPDAAFALLRQWHRSGSNIARKSGDVVVLPDTVSWEDNDHRRPTARKDGAVQVAGINVYPERIAQRIARHPLVAGCQVFLDETLAEPRLRAEILPASGAEPSEVVALCDRWARRNLSAPERPITIAISSGSRTCSEAKANVSRLGQKMSSVVLPNGDRLLRNDLPEVDARWTARKKAVVVLAIDHGLLSLDDAQDLYQLDQGELEEWRTVSKPLVNT